MLQYDRMEVGKFLKASREKAKLTQIQVSKQLGYSSAQVISNFERGVVVAPLTVLSKMTKLYKSDLNALAEIILESQKRLLLKSLKRSK